MIEDVNAEKALLGAVLVENTCAKKVMDMEEDDFASPVNRDIFAAFKGLYPETAIDLITVNSYIRENFSKREYFSQIGPRLVELINEVQTVANVEHYRELVIEKSLKRRAYHSCNELVRISRDPEVNSDQIIQAMRDAVKSINDRSLKVRGGAAYHKVADLAKGLIEEIRFSPKGIAGKYYLSTGMSGFDSMTGGLFPGLIYLPGRPSSGKTTVSMKIAYNIASTGKPVLYVSLEVIKKMFMVRLMSLIGRIKSQQILHGPTVDLGENLANTFKRLQGTPLYLTTDLISVNRMQQLAESLKEIHGQAPVIFIDRLEMIPDPMGRSSDNMTHRLGRISQELNQMSNSLETAVICLVQMNRDIERRNDKTPLLSDLRDSGALEQDAKMVLFVARDKAKNAEEKQQGLPQMADLFIAKNMNGPTGKINLCFNDEIPTFDELCREEEGYDVDLPF